MSKTINTRKLFFLDNCPLVVHFKAIEKATKMKPLTPINLILSLSGCSLRKLSKSSRRWNHVISVLVILTSILSATKEFLFDKPQKYQLIFVSQVVYFIGHAIFVVLMNRNRDIFTQDIQKLLEKLKERQKHSLRRFSVIVSAVAFIELFRYCLGNAYFNFLYMPRNIAIAITVLSIASSLGNCFIGLIFCLFIIKLLQVFEEIYFERLNTRLHADNYQKDSRRLLMKICQERQAITKLKQSIMECFGVLPVIWFMHLFVYISGAVFISQSNDHVNLPLEIFIGSGLIVYEFLLIVTLIFQVHKHKTFLRIQSREIVEVFFRETDYFVIDSRKEFDKECNSFELSAWGLFVVDKKLLLTFISSLLTFTTLFIQIAQSMDSTVKLNVTVNTTSKQT